MSLRYYTSDGQTPGSTDPRLADPRIGRPLQIAGQGRRAWAKHYPGVLCAVHETETACRMSAVSNPILLYNCGSIIGWPRSWLDPIQCPPCWWDPITNHTKVMLGLV